jgi:endonuclease G
MRRPRAIALVVLALIWPAPVALAQAPEVHSKHFVGGQPTGTPASNDLIIRDSYALSSNDTTKFADWVAYRLTAAEVVGILDLEREWRADPFLDEDETLEPNPDAEDDYRGAFGDARYDRGHLAALASFRGSRNASEVNFYSNIVPQQEAFNRGPWLRLENAERRIACAGTPVWIMIGTLYESAQTALLNADETHTVPSGLWRVVVTQDPTLQVAAFVMDQDIARSADVRNHLVAVDDIELRSGLELFPAFTTSQHDMMEATALTPTEWDAMVPTRACASVR